ncbi:hypothetical protein EXE58_08235 [Nocardioides seonyuensis]|uniref:Helix-turn-helix domain-containing protein n=1 Tax=Nocardioides seonyuensis TaxID=2518371 RepID=A0A4V1BM80_9ACTN|nr:helix-turn-helix domain-containing protein [Nocardioides seonyuensis]QBX55442.1 hypothetical protein EXE58_08235 [Nocardioides seonyuensis]
MDHQRQSSEAAFPHATATLAEAATMLGLSREQVRALVNQGLLTETGRPGDQRIRVSSIRTFSRPNDGAAAQRCIT